MPYFAAKQRKLRSAYYIIVLVLIVVFIVTCYYFWDKVAGLISAGIYYKHYILIPYFFSSNKVFGIIIFGIIIISFLLDTIIENYLNDYQINTLNRHFLVFYYIFMLTCFAILGFIFYAFSLEYYYSSMTIPNFLSVTTLFIMLIWMIYQFKKFYSNKIYGDNNISISGYILARLPKPKPSGQDNFDDISSNLTSSQVRVTPIQTSQIPTLPLLVSSNNEDDSIEPVGNIEQEYATEDTRVQIEDLSAEIQNPTSITPDESENRGYKKITILQKDGKNLVFSSKEVRLIKILAQIKLMDINTAAYILDKDDKKTKNRLKIFKEYGYLDMVSHGEYIIIALKKRGFDLAKESVRKIDLSKLKTGELSNIRHELMITRVFVFYEYNYSNVKIALHLLPNDIEEYLKRTSGSYGKYPMPDLLFRYQLEGARIIIEAIEVELSPNRYKLEEKTKNYAGTNVNLVTYFFQDNKYAQSKNIENNNYYNHKTYEFYNLSKINIFLGVSNDWE